MRLTTTPTKNLVSKCSYFWWGVSYKYLHIRSMITFALDAFEPARFVVRSTKTEDDTKSVVPLDRHGTQVLRMSSVVFLKGYCHSRISCLLVSSIITCQIPKKIINLRILISFLLIVIKNTLRSSLLSEIFVKYFRLGSVYF